MDDPAWSAAAELSVDQFHPKSSTHRPITRARLLYDETNLYVRFSVSDRFVRSVQTEYQSRVSTDSCVEFFIQPHKSAGYLAFEINCGGALLLYYIEDPTRTPESLFRKYTIVPWQHGKMVQVVTSMPYTVEPEITTDVDWWVACAVPFALFEEYVGPISPKGGKRWRGNFFKCADATSHPHWASWAPIGEILRFHQPEFFGQMQFGADVPAEVESG
jgi:hypothetical protein